MRALTACGLLLAIAMLGAIESLLSAVVADRMSGRRHNSNVELFAQGIANIVSPMVGGLPATGAIARTATNVRSGGRTPVAGMIHAGTLLLVLLFAAKLAALVPMAVLGSILLVVLMPSIADVVVKLGAPSYFAIMLFALFTVTAVLGSSKLRGFTSLFLGLTIALVGSQTGQARLTFGRPELADGIDVVVVAVAIFAIGEALWVAAHLRRRPLEIIPVVYTYWRLWQLRHGRLPIVERPVALVPEHERRTK